MNLIGTDRAVDLLKAGKLVILPTDTVYGIAADFSNAEAVKKVYEIKGRTQQKPLIILVSSTEMLTELVKDINAQQKILMEKFWPGALTLIFQKTSAVSDLITAGGETIGIRMPYQNDTLKIIENLGRPIVATSVNKSGEPSLNELAEISKHFPEVSIVDGGKPLLGVESTVLNVNNGQLKILREGAISKETLKKILSK